jgi:biotin synthase
MTRDQIVAAASAAARAGVRTIVLQSGENDDEPAEHLAEVIREIKRAHDVAVTVSAGVKPTETYRLWREAGADRYLLKHETASEFLHGKFCTKSALRRRLSSLKRLKELGYQIGSGGIVGLPGQTVRDLSEDIRLLAELDVDMAAFGPFVPHGQTSLAGEPAGSLELSLRVVAVARIALGPVHIPATSALDAIAPDGRERALRAGADVIMANVTPPAERALYDIYPHRALNSIERVKAICARAGRPIALDHGHSLKRRATEPTP